MRIRSKDYSIDPFGPPPYYESRTSGLKYWLIAAAVAVLLLAMFAGALTHYDVISWEVVRE